MLYYSTILLTILTILYVRYLLYYSTTIRPYYTCYTTNSLALLRQSVNLLLNAPLYHYHTLLTILYVLYYLLHYLLYLRYYTAYTYYMTISQALLRQMAPISPSHAAVVAELCGCMPLALRLCGCALANAHLAISPDELISRLQARAHTSIHTDLHTSLPPHTPPPTTPHATAQPTPCRQVEQPIPPVANPPRRQVEQPIPTPRQVKGQCLRE